LCFCGVFVCLWFVGVCVFIVVCGVFCVCVLCVFVFFFCEF